MVTRFGKHGRLTLRGTFVLLLLSLLSLTLAAPIAAQIDEGLGVGQGHGLEVGINLPALQAIQADINSGVYDRACTAAEHDPTQWHTLVNVEAECHYNHHHGDDPNYVNDIFGTPGEWFQHPGQSISYPWQTFPIPVDGQVYTMPEAVDAAGTMENEAKHEGYYWVVRRDQECDTDDGLFCVKDFRVQFHGMMVGPGAATRFHSMSAEVHVCYDNNDLSSCGMIRTGGWADFGVLYVMDPNDNEYYAAACGHDADYNGWLVRMPLAVDDKFFPIDDTIDEERCHPVITPEMVEDGPYNGDNGRGPQAEWWAHGGSDFRFQLHVADPLGNVYETSPGSGQIENHLFCDVTDAECAWNQSLFTMRLHYIVPLNSYWQGAYVDSETNPYDTVFLSLDDEVYIDRHSGINEECTEVGLDCIPIEYNNVPMSVSFGEGLAGFQHTHCFECQKVDHDISPAGEQWITWFYEKFANYSPPATDH